ncbi:MAG TPA: cysteine--tRNA ligase, partial [Candidatus Limnocylindria bacterium]|nr:cysteine--tRNA ligase [Candidatus Limnocylindria bacterium]
PIQPGKVRMYVCGITPYDTSHLGHGRVYVTFDMFYRLLLFLKYDVTYCRNFTDIDDKLITKAEKEFGDGLRYREIAQRYIDAYHQDMAALGCLRPTYEPRVTETIAEIITFVQGLVDAGKAYVVDGDVYFSISSFPDYGKLSKRNLDDLKVGARVEINEQKRDPLDFALWKSESEGTFWQSPWGWGRPGWHIECSAMAAQYLGKHIDIHAGGLDLIFPHHENEIAQSQALYGGCFANYWMHNGFVTVKQEKMSKSLGNFFTLRQVFEHVPPMVVRYYILSHHYKAPLEFSLDDVQASGKSYKRLCKVFEGVPTPTQAWRVTDATSETVRAMLTFLQDDLNTSGMWGVVFERLATLADDAQDKAQVKAFITTVLGLDLQPIPEKEVAMTPEIEKLLRERDEARAARDWKRADTIRDQLVALGVAVQDKKS